MTTFEIIAIVVISISPAFIYGFIMHWLETLFSEECRTIGEKGGAGGGRRWKLNFRSWYGL